MLRLSRNLCGKVGCNGCTVVMAVPILCHVASGIAASVGRLFEGKKPQIGSGGTAGSAAGVGRPSEGHKSNTSGSVV